MRPWEEAGMLRTAELKMIFRNAVTLCKFLGTNSGARTSASAEILSVLREKLNLR